MGVSADPLTQRVDLSTRRVVDLPPRPSEDHEFDYAAKVWRLNVERAAWRARAERDRRIAATDWTQLPDVAEATKLKWQDYRQALRDVTTQPGFPERIDWPVAP
ncbi:MAG: phage tail assembly chaperone [Chromatiales bacterium]|nr:phage tail assembly chaperone [Chromatiales bacterium]